MTVGELGERMSAAEFTDWGVYYQRMDEAKAEALKESETDG